MRPIYILAYILFLIPTVVYGSKKPAKVLIFYKTAGFYHKSIPDGINAIRKLGEENGFSIDTTANSENINTKNLKQYKAIIFLSPTGEFFNDAQKLAFQTYIRNGGGFVGIHAATDCLFKWDWYGKMIGAYFTDHPKVQEAKLHVVHNKHLSTKTLHTPWKRTDEWYNFRFTNTNIKTLIELDESSYSGGKNGQNHPVAWYHKFEGGRVFYTALGHTPASFTEDKIFLEHLLGGIKYAGKIK